MTQSAAKKYRFYEIDLLRFLAALGVVFYHYAYFGPKTGSITNISYPAVGEIVKYGFLGVHLFFMISGFVILLTATNKDYKGFIISRIVRLYPVYWCGVTLTFLVIFFLGTGMNLNIFQYLANLTMFQGIMGVQHLDGVYWTLTVELKFYFLILLLLLIRQIRNIKYFLGLWLLLTLMLVFVDGFQILRFIVLAKWSSFFIAGAAFYLIRRDGVSFYKFLLIVISYGISLKYLYVEMHNMYQWYDIEFNYSILVALLTAFYFVFALIALEKTGFVNKSWFYYMGVLTYPLYLIHQDTGYVFIDYLQSYVNKYVLLFIMLFFMLFVSYLIHRCIEQRISVPFKRFLLRISSIKVKKAETKMVDIS